jgi:hypothetical protein
VINLIVSKLGKDYDDGGKIGASGKVKHKAFERIERAALL